MVRANPDGLCTQIELRSHFSAARHTERLKSIVTEALRTQQWSGRAVVGHNCAELPICEPLRSKHSRF